MAQKSRNVKNKQGTRTNTRNIKKTNPGVQKNYNKQKTQTRTKNNKKRVKLKRILFFIILVITVTGAFLFLMNSYIFKVGKIEVNENFKYTQEEIIAAGELSVGMELYSLPLREIEQNIKNNLPYIKNVKLTQIPPSTLRINVSLENGTSGIKLGGDYYILSDDFKVLEKISTVEKTEEIIVAEMLANNIIVFDTHVIRECYVGKYVQFQDDDILDFLSRVLKVVEENQIYGVIDKIDVVDKFYVKMEYDNRFSVELGSFEDIETKILTLIAVIDTLPKDAKGIFERNSQKSWSFVPTQW